jgi:hypothetical protein
MCHRHRFAPEALRKGAGVTGEWPLRAVRFERWSGFPCRLFVWDFENWWRSWRAHWRAAQMLGTSADGIMDVKVSKEQWDTVKIVQTRHGVSDLLVATLLGCGATTVRTHRNNDGWTTRILPEGFMTAEMLRQTGATDLGTFDLFGEEGVQPSLDEASLRRAQERLLALIVNETARVGLSAIDPLAVKRLEVMSSMARSFEKIMELKAKLAPPVEVAGGAEKTAAVLAHMDRRVDELANRRARDIVEQCCRGGECRAVLPDAD